MRLLRWTLAAAAAAVLLALAGLAFAAWNATQRETRLAIEAAPPGGRFVRANDVEAFIQERGPPDGPVALFVHGSGAWSEVWRDPLGHLGARGLHAVAIDLPPFGYSQRPDPPRYSKADQARRILGVLDSLHIERATLVGHSFGGGPTVEAALLAPQRVERLVLIDAALGIDASSAPPAPARAVLGFAPLRDALVAAFGTNPRFTRRLLQGFIADPAAATDAWTAIYQRPLDVRGSTRAIGEWLPELVAPVAPSASERSGSYAALQMPATIIWGSADSITPLEQGRRLATLLPGSRLVVLEGIGHIPQIEDPARFREALLAAFAAPPS